ncbi:hypothetical protein GGE45_001656 [Rhizobium aethiopicum]|uniref:Uncharacterized protein n=1 Tax=Rhizobium aethiopicum TaxID=1138170 RepID=A0A7W6MI14_9HYPH|nr:hypothetical protein [Rhizobium aethiopicum]MBB4579332.1 hypothetical protein [Rhizobium aethiopicum]
MQRVDHRQREERLLTIADALAGSAFPGTTDPVQIDEQDLSRETDQAKNRFLFLDELRGIAALSVVLLHASHIFGWP